MSRLRLDLIVRDYWTATKEGGPVASVDRWSWRLWAGGRIVSTSGSQLYSRRIDCARGAEVGAGLFDVARAIKHGHLEAGRLVFGGDFDPVTVRILDERGQS